MMIVSGEARASSRAWGEVDDDIAVAEPADAPATAAPAASTAAPSGWLDSLPPAEVQPPPTAPPQAAAPAPAPAAASYTGERPVDAAWLAARESALVAVRADYEAARARAQADPSTGTPGWTPAVVVTDESGQIVNPGNALRVFVDAAGQPQSVPTGPLITISDESGASHVVTWDESGQHALPSGQWLEFDEAAFAASYRAQGGTPLQALAAQYGTDAATLLAQHPDIWALASADHALNAGPAPAGVAMGNAGQLGMLDLYLADPQISALIDAYGGTVAPATGGIALEQVRLYGQARYAQLSRLGNAMQSVRAQYAGALANAAAGGSAAGWVEREVAVYATDESGQPFSNPIGTTTERSFDPDAFTAWYEQQDGLPNRAFADFYGLSTTTRGYDASGQLVVTGIGFTNPNWSMSGIGASMTHAQLVGIDPNHPPDLNDPTAVGFDLEAGWATSQSNLHQDTDWFEIVAQVVIVAAVSYFSAGTLGPEVAGAIGVTSQAGVAIVSAAVAGAASSTVSGAMNGNLTFKGVLQGALAGGLTAGLMNGLGGAVGQLAGPAGTIALRTTVQGGIQALLGGSFKDGAIAGFASGLADLASANIGKGIDDAVKAGTMSPTDAMAARSLARIFGSAVRALGNPNAPGYGFASALVNDVVGQALQPAPTAPTAPTPVAQTPAGGDVAQAPPPVPSPPAAAEPPAADTEAQAPPPVTSAGGAPSTPPPASAATPPAADETAPPPASTTPEPSSPTPASPQPLWTAADGRPVFPIESAPPTGTLRPVEGEQPVFPNPELLPAGASVTALRDDAGNLYWHVVADGVDQTVTVASVSVLPPVVVTASRAGYAQFDAALSAAAAAGRVWTADELMALAAKLLGRALSGIGELVEVLPDLGLKSLGVGVSLLTYSGNAGGGSEQVQLNADQRFVKSSDMVYGSLQQRDANGDWQTVKTDVRLVTVGTQRMALTDEELRTLTAPLTNPADPQPNPPLVTPMPTDGQNPQPLPGYPSTGPALPSTETLPAAPPPTPDDLIITSTKTPEERYADAIQAWKNNPQLRHPDQTLGETDGGPGTWGLPGERPKGQDYEEQVTGVPRGVEYNVAGVWFDGYDKTRNVLLDAKDWGNYVLPDKDFWIDEVVKTADRQTRAVVASGTNATIEWQVPTEEAADEIRARLAKVGFDNIKVVVVPKKGP